jgi:hypothetical protein
VTLSLRVETVSVMRQMMGRSPEGAGGGDIDDSGDDRDDSDSDDNVEIHY